MPCLRLGLLGLLALLGACGPLRADELAAFELEPQPAGDEPLKFDTLPEIDAGQARCLACRLTIASRQSGAFALTGQTSLSTATLADQIVYALGSYGAGRFIAAADSALPFREQTDCPLHAWLAGRPGPASVLLMGWTERDGPNDFDVDATFAGVHLPAQYLDAPGLLADDYDVVVYLEASRQFDGGDAPSDAEIATLLAYVADHGGGLYVASEFADPVTRVYLDAADLASVNRLLLPLGLEALPVNLDWGDVTGELEFECFPPPAG